MRTAVITGGAGGLGRALCHELLADGWHVEIMDLPSEALDRLGDQTNVTTYACDLTDDDDLDTTTAAIIAARPSIDLVIYSAGITQIGRFDETSAASRRKIFEVNYFSAVACAKWFLLPLRNSKGIHLAISSVAGFSPLFKRTAYAASKHALEGFFNSLRSEEKQYGVACLIAAPSFIATNVGHDDEQSNTTSRPGSAADAIDPMSPRDAARIILKGVNRRKPMIPVGRVAWMAWLVSRLSPRLFQWLMERQINKH